MLSSAGCQKKIKNFCGTRDIIVIVIPVAYQKYWLVPLTGTGQVFQKYIHYFSSGLLYHPWLHWNYLIQSKKNNVNNFCVFIVHYITSFSRGF